MAGMLSLPRDLWVPIPGFDTNKINLAYSIGEEENYRGGGAQLVKDTVSSFIGQPVQYYVRVNFHGFVELIDLIGGVDVQLPTIIHDEEYPTTDYGVETFHLEAGLQHLDGETALKYARTRHVDDDYGRARRQQDLLKAVLAKVLSADMIPTLLTKLPQLMYTMRSSIDTDIPMATGLELANYAHQSSPTEIRQLVLDSRYGEETYSADGAWILLPDRTKVRAAVEEFFQPPTASEGISRAVALADPKAVRIEILNGTDEPGVAAQTRALLEARGWQVVAIGDADRHDYGRTLVINYGVSPTLIEEVSADLNLQPSLAALPGLNTNRAIDMRIVVGNDFLPTVR
jgi:LCP family protein required for cell wall assembly